MHKPTYTRIGTDNVTCSNWQIRFWCNKFGAPYARRFKRRRRGYGDTFLIDEVFVRIEGKLYYLWRAVDQDAEVVDVYLQAKREGAAAKRFLKQLMLKIGGRTIWQSNLMKRPESGSGV